MSIKLNLLKEAYAEDNQAITKQQALDSATSVKQKEDIINQYINLLWKGIGEDGKPVSNKKDQKVVDDETLKYIKPYLTKYLREQGLVLNSNPFVYYIYLITIGNYDTKTIKGNPLGLVEELWKEREISDSDLKAQGKDRGAHIIFNKDWLSKTNVNEQKFLLETYLWLSKDRNVKTLALDEIANNIKVAKDNAKNKKANIQNDEEKQKDSNDKAIGNWYSLPSAYQELSKSNTTLDNRNLIMFGTREVKDNSKDSNKLLAPTTIDRVLWYNSKEEDDYELSSEKQKEALRQLLVYINNNKIDTSKYNENQFTTLLNNFGKANNEKYKDNIKIATENGIESIKTYVDYMISQGVNGSNQKSWNQALRSFRQKYYYQYLDIMGEN